MRQLLRRQASVRRSLLLSAGLALGVGCLHLVLLLVELGLADPRSDLRLTGGSVAWWWGSAGYQLLRADRMRLLERRTVLLGHVVALTAVGVLSDVPGEPWACSAGLVALPLGAALSQNRTTVVGTLVLSGLGSGAVVLVHTQPLALGLYCTLAVLVTTVLPTLLYLQLRSALRRARDEALTLAVTDPLTGLLNRRGMELSFPALRASAFGGLRVAVAVFDIDHFKRVNDELGHEAGDEVLVHVAGVLRARARPGDLVVRLGGEELAWVGLWPREEALLGAADGMRRALAESPAPNGCSVTASAGLVLCGGEADALGDCGALSRLLVRADAALYEAKRTGRDRVVLAPAVPTAGTHPGHGGAPAPRVRDGGSGRAVLEGQRA